MDGANSKDLFEARTVDSGFYHIGDGISSRIADFFIGLIASAVIKKYN
jgi:hypothetical protein